MLASFLTGSENSYNGEDVTRPIDRFDVRLKAQSGVGHSNGNTCLLTLRSDLAISLPEDWQIGLRIDVPFESFRCPRRHDNCSSCYDSNHLADSLFQAFLITPEYGKWTFGIGGKIIFPTAGKNLEIGDGKYQALPSGAIKYDLSSWSTGSYWGVIVRHDFSFAGYSSAPQVSETYIQPSINISLPKNWFVNSSPEMFYDWKTSQWFVPFDLMIGKMVGKNLVISLEYEVAIVDEYPSYGQQLEFRVGVFF